MTTARYPIRSGQNKSPISQYINIKACAICIDITQTRQGQRKFVFSINYPILGCRGLMLKKMNDWKSSEKGIQQKKNYI